MPGAEGLRPHEWIVAPYREGRIAAAGRRGGNGYTIDLHRNRRGPFGGAGALVCALIERHGEAVAMPRLVTLLSVAPDIRTMLAVPAGIERSFAFSREGNRRSWSLRIAHGVVDFVLDCAAAESGRPATILFHSADHAGPLDLVFIGALLRRADPETLLVRLTSARADADTFLPRSAAERLRLIRSGRGACRPPGRSAIGREALAAAYVDGDCVDDDALACAAYRALGAAEREALHRKRAAALELGSLPSSLIGALPFHREHAGGGPEALVAASHRCMHLACYEAALDWAIRACVMCDPVRDAALIAEMTRNRLFALLLLDRHDEVEALCALCLAEGRDPALLSHACYALAILEVRLHDAPRRDLDAARRHIAQALGFTRELPASEVRATNIAFLQNTLALVEVRSGNSAGALRLLSEALSYLAREAPGSVAVESIILLHNRARLNRADGNDAAAIADLGALLELEPSNPEALFDRGRMHQDAGRHQDAVRDYDAADFWGPPHGDTLLNRARAFGALGRWDAALADYDRLLAIDPDLLPALIDRACLHYVRRGAGARKDVETGLRLAPADARLLCLRGLLDLRDGALDAALASMTMAVGVDPGLADAWANRATVLRRFGRDDEALCDLDHALTLRDDPVIRGNRARIFEALERPPQSAQGS